MRRSRRPGRGRSGGFTLLEVLVALVILGVALVGLLSAQSAAVRLRSQAEELTLATFLLERQMTEMEMGDFPEIGKKEGDFGDDYPGYAWQITVSETPFSAPPQVRVREVRVAVLWSAGPRPERLELVRYMIQRQGGSS